MNRQLTYILITPYSLLKSRTGGIIGRILALGRDVRFVGARMYAPSDDMVDRYLATLDAEEKPAAFLSALKIYVDSNLRQENPFGISNRMMMLLFEGPDAIQALRRNVVGDLSFDVKGDTVRGTYGDFVRKHGDLTHFEPAVLMPSTEEAKVSAPAKVRVLTHATPRYSSAEAIRVAITAIGMVRSGSCTSSPSVAIRPYPVNATKTRAVAVRNETGEPSPRWMVATFAVPSRRPLTI